MPIDGLTWLLVALPLVFALGWLAARMDWRQLRREQRDGSRAYYKGLNLLLNEQQDKAIDAFIEAVQADPDTTELHFGLGNLFRRRGEFERAVRVHQHLLARADLPATEHDRAQHALAQDFMKAGLFDRAEAAYRALLGTAFDTEARLALLGVHERAHDWAAAITTASELERAGVGSFAGRLAHYHCELALEADARGDAATAEAELARALEAAPQASRPWLLRGERAANAGDAEGAWRAWDVVRQRSPEHFLLVAQAYADSARASGHTDEALARLREAYANAPALALLSASATLEDITLATQPALVAELNRRPTLGAAEVLLTAPAAAWPEGAQAALAQAVTRAGQPLHRHRCVACGFESARYFWQCPGCLSWDSMPARQIDAL
ncbi:MAG: lipopolysaccharide assembly protein LapB [Proteobacteria bacterium]|nr:lipopolysaccharide assembly protein LapB [Pseudomonadota bacterium]